MLDPAAPFIRDQTEFSVTSKWDEIREELQQRMELEEKKYPMTVHEKIMYDTLCRILSTLHSM
jgi:hypothetical protein